MGTLFYFNADATRYCIAGEAVARVVWLPALSSLDGVPAWFVGVLNLQGQRIVVIDFSVWMGHAQRPYSVKQKLLIIKSETSRAAVLIDEVEGLKAWSGALLSIEKNSDSPHLLGQVRDGDDMVMLVSVAALIDSSQHWALQDVRAASLVHADVVGDVALLQSRMHQLAKELSPLRLDILLSFAIVSTGARRYAVDLAQVMEFSLLKQFTFLPGCQAAVLGCMNLRGEIISILDLGILLGLEPSPHDAELLVLQHAGLKFSFAIEAIERLVVAAESNIIDMPDQDDQRPLSHALLRDNGEITPILNLDAVFALCTSQPAVFAHL